MLETTLNPTTEEFVMIYLLSVNRLAREVSELKGGGSIAERVAMIRRLNTLRANCQVLERLAFPDAEQI